MKRILSTFALLISTLGMVCHGENGEGYVYTNNTDGTKTITLHEENSSITEIIVPIEIGGIRVSQISGLLGNFTKTNPCPNVNRIFIPAGIHITQPLATDKTSLVTMAIDNGSLTPEKVPFVFSTASSSSVAPTVFVFGGSNSTKVMTEAAKTVNAGVCKVQFTDGNNLIIQSYQFNGLSASRAKLFTATRYEGLIWAIKQRLATTPDETRTFSDITCIDLTGLTQATITFDDEYNPANLLDKYGATVKVSDSKTYTNDSAPNGTIADLQDFTTPSANQTTTINYTRQNTGGWNTVCLPFDLAVSELPAGCEAYTLSDKSTATEVRLQRLADNATITAGTPCLIWSTATSWTLRLSERQLKASVTPQSITQAGWTLTGSFTEQVIGAGHYKIDSNGAYLAPTNGAEAKAYPMRCYLTPAQPAGARQRIAVTSLR